MAWHIARVEAPNATPVSIQVRHFLSRIILQMNSASYRRTAPVTLLSIPSRSTAFFSLIISRSKGGNWKSDVFADVIIRSFLSRHCYLSTNSVLRILISRQYSLVNFKCFPADRIPGIFVFCKSYQVAPGLVEIQI